MKKCTIILLTSSLAFGVAGCQASTQQTADQEPISEEVVEEPADEVAEEDVEEPEAIDLGEQVEVNTEYGDFLLTVDNVRKCDWVERIGNEADKYVAVLVECDIENISYEDPYNDAFWIDQFLTSTDDEGYVVSALGYGYDDGLYYASTTLEIPVGSKGRIFVAYNCGIDIQSLTIDINGQYVLETQIEDETGVESEESEQVLETQTEDESSSEIDRSERANRLRIQRITNILGRPLNADGEIEVNSYDFDFFNDAELFGCNGTVGAQDDSLKVTTVYWISNDEYGDSDEYTDIINDLKDIYGECAFENEDFEGILNNACIWTDGLSDCDMVACGLNALDDNDQVAVYWFYDTSEYETEDMDSTTASEGSPENLGSLDGITTRENEIIEEYKKYFEDAGVEYEVSPNGLVLFGTEMQYQILDKSYRCNEMVSVDYNYYKSQIEIAINTTFHYHEEKGIDKDNAHVKLLYDFLSNLGAYSSMDEMIADMEDNDSGSSNVPGGLYNWRKGNASITFYYKCTEECSYKEEITYYSCDTMDEREEKIEEYRNLIKQKYSDAGLGDDVSTSNVVDGWTTRTLFLEQDNDLGLFVKFSNFLTDQENIDSSRQIIKIYVDAADEVFGHTSDVPSEMIIDDILTKAMLKNYSDSSKMRMYKSDDGDISLPTATNQGSNYINPLQVHTFIQSGFLIDNSGPALEFYIPITVEGLYNR